MQIKEFNHREMLRAGNLTDLQIRWRGEGKNKEFDFFGDIERAKKELKGFAKGDFQNALETSQDIKELVQDAAKAKASIECDLSYTSPRGVDYDVYYNVGPYLIEDFLKENNCCKRMQELIIDHITTDQYGDLKIDRQAIVDEVKDDTECLLEEELIDCYMLEEELLDSYIEAIEEAAGWHLLTLEECNEEEERDMDLLNEILDSYI